MCLSQLELWNADQSGQTAKCLFCDRVSNWIDK